MQGKPKIDLNADVGEGFGVAYRVEIIPTGKFLQ
jgi:hypothetical protein